MRLLLLLVTTYRYVSSYTCTQVVFSGVSVVRYLAVCYIIPIGILFIAHAHTLGTF